MNHRKILSSISVCVLFAGCIHNIGRVKPDPKIYKLPTTNDTLSLLIDDSVEDKFSLLGTTRGNKSNPIEVSEFRSSLEAGIKNGFGCHFKHINQVKQIPSHGYAIRIEGIYPESVTSDRIACAISTQFIGVSNIGRDIYQHYETTSKPSKVRTIRVGAKASLYLDGKLIKKSVTEAKADQSYLEEQGKNAGSPADTMENALSLVIENLADDWFEESSLPSNSIERNEILVYLDPSIKNHFWMDNSGFDRQVFRHYRDALQAEILEIFSKDFTKVTLVSQLPTIGNVLYLRRFEPTLIHGEPPATQCTFGPKSASFSIRWFAELLKGQARIRHSRGSFISNVKSFDPAVPSEVFQSNIRGSLENMRSDLFGKNL